MSIMPCLVLVNRRCLDNKESSLTLGRKETASLR